MTRINTQPQTPYTPGYDMSPNPAPVRHEHSADDNEYSAATQDSTPPRNVMTAQQRGNFSSHTALVNHGQMKGAETGQLAQLTRQNQALNEKFNALIAKFESMIKGLQQRIADLTRQLEHPKEATQETPFDNGSQVRHAPVERQNPAQTSDLEALSSQNDQFYQHVNEALRRLAGLLMELSQQIDGLFQRISGAGGSANDTPTLPADYDKTIESDGLQPQAPAARKSEETTPVTQPEASATRTIEELMRENEQLNTHLDKSAEAYEQFIAQLQQKVDSLSQQVSQQKK
ncbi:hypothetical protein [Pseudomonas poae]|uniref:hypothetical protein n=1 Tax=Pseudomonas poae TaxID=200451 RepID=UPI0021CD15EB|nr:hypothetical protein [Pseudomonas poae]